MIDKPEKKIGSMLDILQEEIIDIRVYRLDIDDVVINFYKTFKDLLRKHETSHTDVKMKIKSLAST